MTTCIVVAGGEGRRFGRVGGKQLARLAGVPVLAHAVAGLAACRSIDRLVVACDPDRREEYAKVVAAAAGDTPFEAVPGGSTRQLSVRAGLEAVPVEEDVVVVHDGARPLVATDWLDRAVGLLGEHAEIDGVVIGHHASDTLKVVSETGEVVETPDRSTLWAVQTPQVFRADRLRAAHAAAEREAWSGTDDASLIERAGGRVRVVEGPRTNIKITTGSDLVCVEALLAAGERDGD